MPSPTREQAIQKAKDIDPWKEVRAIASIRVADGYAAFTARLRSRGP